MNKCSDSDAYCDCSIKLHVPTDYVPFRISMTKGSSKALFFQRNACKATRLTVRLLQFRVVMHSLCRPYRLSLGDRDG